MPVVGVGCTHRCVLLRAQNIRSVTILLSQAVASKLVLLYYTINIKKNQYIKRIIPFFVLASLVSIVGAAL